MSTTIRTLRRRRRVFIASTRSRPGQSVFLAVAIPPAERGRGNSTPGSFSFIFDDSVSLAPLLCRRGAIRQPCCPRFTDRIRESEVRAFYWEATWPMTRIFSQTRIHSTNSHSIILSIRLDLLSNLIKLQITHSKSHPPPCRSK